ncbi:Uncharacterized protein HZ326_0934 [Fusarium oxysporum f. sp. albedinis]|nr:Uncharacterized protein HZ326_0934 [Fusarium oxysporum f. sp. albedinis]
MHVVALLHRPFLQALGSGMRKASKWTVLACFGGSRIRKFSATVTAFMMLFRTEDWRPAMAKIGSAHR